MPTLDENKGSQKRGFFPLGPVTPQLLSTYCVPGCVLGAGGPAVQ